MKSWSFLKNGSAKKNNPIGSTKNWIPPQEEMPNAKNIPAPMSLTNEILEFLELIALRNKYI